MAWLESLANLRMAAWQWQTAFWSVHHRKHCMVPSASPAKSRPHKTLLAEWTREPLSLSLTPSLSLFPPLPPALLHAIVGKLGAVNKQSCLSFLNAWVSHKLHRPRCRTTSGVAYPVPLAKHETPMQNCISSCSLETGIGMSDQVRVAN